MAMKAKSPKLSVGARNINPLSSWDTWRGEAIHDGRIEVRHAYTRLAACWSDTAGYEIR